MSTVVRELSEKAKAEDRRKHVNRVTFLPQRVACEDGEEVDRVLDMHSSTSSGSDNMGTERC